jgi:hypothetical protein
MRFIINHLIYTKLMITRHFNLRALNYLTKFRFSGGHHHHEKVYDWRDDPSANHSYEHDFRLVGTKDPMEYTFPHTATAPAWIYSSPDKYNQKDLSQNSTQSSRVIQITNNPYCP